MSELNPGSPEAVAAGCTCPTIDNGHGLGYRHYPGKERPQFIRVQTCPLHGWGK